MYIRVLFKPVGTCYYIVLSVPWSLVMAFWERAFLPLLYVKFSCALWVFGKDMLLGCIDS